MRNKRRWNLAETHPRAQELADRLRTTTLVAQMLLNRGMEDVQTCQGYLKPSLKCLHEPDLLADLPRAAERIAKAIRDGEKIVIYGDYDVDGITATSILWHAIRRLGGNAEPYIPHRIDEGYGLNAEAVRELCQGGAKLLITVDCGITAIEPAKVARALGVDLIVTDHHEWQVRKVEAGNAGLPSSFSLQPSALIPMLPDCFAVVHPRLTPPGGTPYPNPSLCGAGVAFKLAWGIGLAMSGANRVNDDFRRFLVDATALAALGTIADVVPLVGENRILAHFGLTGLKASGLVGLKALIASANLDGKKLDSYHVGFLLAPRLNACGRMGHARLAVEMLTTADPARADEIARYLEQQNRDRQAIERDIFAKAIAQAEQLKLDAEDTRGVVLGDIGWHPGVIGIVASRMVERLHRPTVMVAVDESGKGSGSGRSISGFHLAAALHACGEFLDTHGGHEMAAGLKMRAASIPAFRDAFDAHARSVLSADHLVRELKLDCLADLDCVTEALVLDLKRLGPFGQGNRKPLLCCRGLELVSPPRRVGRTGDHLQLYVRQGNRSMKAIAFNAGDLFDQLKPGVRLDLAVEPQINEFNGRKSVELEVKDLVIG